MMSRFFNQLAMPMIGILRAGLLTGLIAVIAMPVSQARQIDEGIEYQLVTPPLRTTHQFIHQQWPSH